MECNNASSLTAVTISTASRDVVFVCMHMYSWIILLRVKQFSSLFWDPFLNGQDHKLAIVFCVVCFLPPPPTTGYRKKRPLTFLFLNLSLQGTKTLACNRAKCPATILRIFRREELCSLKQCFKAVPLIEFHLSSSRNDLFHSS